MVGVKQEQFPCSTNPFPWTDSPSSKSTPINWKEGVQLGQVSQEVNKTSRKRRLESTRTSFFTWFTDNVDPCTDNIAEDFKVLEGWTTRKRTRCLIADSFLWAVIVVLSKKYECPVFYLGQT